MNDYVNNWVIPGQIAVQHARLIIMPLTLLIRCQNTPLRLDLTMRVRYVKGLGVLFIDAGIVIDIALKPF